MMAFRVFDRSRNERNPVRGEDQIWQFIQLSNERLCLQLMKDWNFEPKNCHYLQLMKI